jgi:hypothetical protein
LNAIRFARTTAALFRHLWWVPARDDGGAEAVGVAVVTPKLIQTIDPVITPLTCSPVEQSGEST